MLKAGSVWALGAMSGTSLDGVDAAMVLTDGHRILEFGHSSYREYNAKQREVIRAGFGKWQDEDGIEAASEVVEATHAAILGLFDGAELVGFHGQTLAHDPGARRTHQAGSGDVLAQVLGLPVVWDFRTADVELGGQGAPLAPFFHFACAKYIGATAPLAFLNLGGVGNLTWVDPRHNAPEEPGACLAFDTGPANAPINDLVATRLGLVQDQDGALAASGMPDERVIAQFLRHPYFFKMPPKSLDRNDFAALLTDVAD
ncbi:anhydro-N-acetylmuramic acid kinase, partial [Pseudorhodobacter sp.]|uniref:anhydro-N-acetylmuramic acid kinase n=1 Tax=Pseudorhodobacter sp. TaxID=1934400 RepID=UPI002648CFF4